MLSTRLGAMVLLVAIVATLALPAVVLAQDQQQDQQQEETSIWDRVYFGLSVKTWVAIIALIVVVEIVMEGFGWLIVLGAVAYFLWKFLQ